MRVSEEDKDQGESTVIISKNGQGETAWACFPSLERKKWREKSKTQYGKQGFIQTMLGRGMPKSFGVTSKYIKRHHRYVSICLALRH